MQLFLTSAVIVLSVLLPNQCQSAPVSGSESVVQDPCMSSKANWLLCRNRWTQNADAVYDDWGMVPVAAHRNNDVDDWSLRLNKLDKRYSAAASFLNDAYDLKKRSLNPLKIEAEKIAA